MNEFIISGFGPSRDENLLYWYNGIFRSTVIEPLVPYYPEISMLPLAFPNSAVLRANTKVLNLARLAQALHTGPGVVGQSLFGWPERHTSDRFQSPIACLTSVVRVSGSRQPATREKL